jgi:hypothetical protein
MPDSMDKVASAARVREAAWRAMEGLFMAGSLGAKWQGRDAME